MNQAELDIKLCQHEQWLDGQEDGIRLSLANEDLRNLDFSTRGLRRAVFYGADLRGSSFYEADMLQADMRQADFRHTNLVDALLAEARIGDTDFEQAKGIIHPQIDDPRGYRCIAVMYQGAWRIASGCRWFTLGEAYEHWGRGYDGKREIGDLYITALDLFNEEYGLGRPYPPKLHRNLDSNPLL